MVDTLKTLKPGNIIVAGDVIFKIAKMGPVHLKREILSSRSGLIQYEQAVVRSCPPGFDGGKLSVDDYGNYKLHRHIDGDFSPYAKMMDQWNIDLTCAAVGEGNWMPTYDIGDLTKLDLIAYVIAIHGPSMREDIMRRVAALESLPWIPTSNTEYFSNVASANAPGMYGKPRDSTMEHAGKVGRKQLYGLGALGKKRAAIAIARLGEGPAHAVK